MNTATKSQADDHPVMVIDCQKKEAFLSEWESEFIDSIGRQLGQNCRLSCKQHDRLDEIWERVT